jgi:GNAT superfamily N-acetyltransferase
VIRVYRIRPSRGDDLGQLPAIERATAPLFAPYGLAEHFAAVTTPPELFTEAHERGTLWVAEVDDRAVGFALASELDGTAHLEELDVHPDFLRRGLGSALLHAMARWAEDAGYPAMTLLTLRDIPWHVPFYRRHGFRAVPPGDLTPGLAALLRSDDGQGIAPQKRVILRRDLGRQGLPNVA